jgi:hypothetical protein
MPTADNSYFTRYRFISGRTLSIYHRQNPNQPIEGPNGNVQSSTITAMIAGSGPFIQNSHTKIECCDTIAAENTIITASDPPGPPVPPLFPEGLYFAGFYFSTTLPWELRDTTGTAVDTLPLSTTQNTYLAKYNNTTGVPIWSSYVRSTSSGQVTTTNSTVDENGNMYIVGYYNSDIELYNSDGSSSGVTLTYTGSDVNSFIAKYDYNGAAQWATRIVGTGTSTGAVGGVQPYCVTVDTNLNVCIQIIYDLDIDIYSTDSTVSAVTFVGTGYSTNILTAKFNTAGELQWTATMVPIVSGKYSQPSSIKTDTSGSVYVTGYIQDSIQVNNSNGTSFGTITTTSYGYYLIKYNRFGAVIWTTKLDGAGDEYNDILLDVRQSDIYITTSFASTTFTLYNSDSSAFVPTLPKGTGAFGGAVVKYNSSGFVQWGAYLQNNNASGYVIPNAISTSDTGDIYISGINAISGSTVTLYSTAGVAGANYTNAGTGGNTTAFTAKYSTAGVPQWIAKVETINTTNNRQIQASLMSIEVDNNGDILTAYTHYTQGGGGDVKIYNSAGAASSYSYTATNGSIPFVVKYDSNGLIIYSFQNYGVSGAGGIRGITGF